MDIKNIRYIGRICSIGYDVKCDDVRNPVHNILDIIKNIVLGMFVFMFSVFICIMVYRIMSYISCKDSICHLNGSYYDRR